MFGSLLYSWNLFDINFRSLRIELAGRVKTAFPMFTGALCLHFGMLRGLAADLQLCPAWAKQLEELQEEPEDDTAEGGGATIQALDAG
ncbi:hypothetical protein AK812_SmicGene33820 [Symbiodinium microadriaticum]|uniref:Uncharacterized protein n=1 Tax=Symbiodinium microadriaticum TaxID=2951 RepID=A0A1Q9CQJ9_SYMMI|nr:hypothetical protein AK812_SmicGene33820 [Symbiodinium microadriaticum]